VKFVSDDFEVPEKLVLDDGIVIRPIGIDDAVKDYDAVMTSRTDILDSYWRAPGWPSPNLTLRQNLIDLAWHHKERELRRSFAYIAVNDHDVELACIYVDPPIKKDFDAEVQFWTRSSHRDELDERLYEALQAWLRSDGWPWDRVAFPGREYSADQWAALGDRH
jgi:hypothetical protein